MTLRTEITADVTDVFLQVDDFAEDITFIPASGASRTVRCIVEAEREYFDTEVSTEQLDRIRVFVSRSASGIPTIDIGDSVKRSVTFDPEQRQYGFTGDIEFPEPDTVWLLFARKRQKQFGIGQKGLRI